MENITNNCRFVEELHLAPKVLICMNPESENYLGVVKDCKCEFFKKNKDALFIHNYKYT